VRGVENFLHLPKTPSPTRADSPASQRKTQRSTKRTTAKSKPRSGHKKTTAEPESIKRADQSEPAPDELASRREGRQPAPLGAEESGGSSGSGSSSTGSAGSGGNGGGPS